MLFACGTLRGCPEACLVDAAGKEAPCWVRPVAGWYDGSIKWLMVDAQVSCPAGGEAHLALQPGRRPAAIARSMKVAEDAGDITVDTGPARILFSKQAFGLPAAAWADLNGDGEWDTQVSRGGGAFVCEVAGQCGGVSTHPPVGCARRSVPAPQTEALRACP